MSDVIDPPNDVSAWKDPATRRALAIYGAKTAGWFGVAVVGTAAFTPMLDDEGNAKPGVPDFLPWIPGMIAALAAIAGLACLWQLTRMTWNAVRYPWRVAHHDYQHFTSLAPSPNGQPVFHLVSGDVRWTLTPAALVWRWDVFADSPYLLIAAPNKRGGLAATPDRSAIVWAGRSPYTAVIVWMQKRFKLKP